MGYKIWLDDIRPAPDKTWIHEETAEDMIALMRQILDWGLEIEIISLDNDLGKGRMEGYKVLDWLESLMIPVNFEIHIHSANPVARERMRTIIQHNGWKELK